MSHFIVFMPSLVFSDSPPESNVTPLPTIASAGAPSPPPLCLSTTTRGGLTLPCATAKSEPIRSSRSRFSSSTSHASPHSVAAAAARSANVSG